ncbi:MAG: hypothetical protein GY938_13045 [Ketobacter sp.]|nr:hypothetical protein [Ketobacter sp.]
MVSNKLNTAMINKDQILDILETFGMACLQGLTILQMAARRCQTRFGSVDRKSLVAMFQVMLEDIDITEPRPLPDEIPAIALGDKGKTSPNKLLSGVTGIAGLPLGVLGKKMKVLGVPIPESAIIDILKIMFDGTVFKSRGICPVISEILENYDVLDTPEDIEYHIACRLVTTHKKWLEKIGTKYRYAQ